MMTESEIKIEQFEENLVYYSEIRDHISDEQKRQLVVKFPKKIESIKENIAIRNTKNQELELEIEALQKRIRKNNLVIRASLEEIKDLELGIEKDFWMTNF